MQRVRLDRLMSNLGYCTRSKVKGVLAKLQVRVDGKIVPARTVVDPKTVTIAGENIKYYPPISLAFHKPAGYICSSKREYEGAKLVFDLLPPELRMLKDPPLFLAGRLDKNVTGLLIMSQNTQLIENLMGSKSQPERRFGKEYLVKTHLPFQGDEKKLFASGKIKLIGEDEALLPAEFEVIAHKENTAKVTLYEGVYHQITRMFRAIGNRVDWIHRVRVGPVHLGDLEEGQFRMLTEKEMNDIEKNRPKKGSPAPPMASLDDMAGQSLKKVNPGSS
ncbi:hypothetical protein PROFUN_05421 [Planoprotostelium fungivorum]|uniref:Pseudouridine synthase RsuA/RluA-like domain-containing protein n=1 Tax=Planoprotostelium fungivorum TaxID=1890364 RepID=A0A2P6NQQ8_9EUKA|nr:hypothetical protein PROFUN_05421 [Planoprotostelium fungivorum]